MCWLINKQALEKPGDKRKIFKSAGSHAGPLKGLREARWCLWQMHEKSLLGEYNTALLHSPVCTLNFHLSHPEPGNQISQTCTERKPPGCTNTAFASVAKNWGCYRKGSYISLKALVKIMSLLTTKISCMTVRNFFFISIKHLAIISRAVPFSQAQC